MQLYENFMIYLKFIKSVLREITFWIFLNLHFIVYKSFWHYI